ncbi:DnaJ-like chaperonin [Gordonia phage Pupper]|uniref:DnaJ-like chaperonin n=1 Tax=Gordonia phage Pupper TaxID=2571249 RepID=A0A4Y6EIS8_9CAUD|nr:DnaJ-like chaperonin [Gordonia phage Pupper]QDF18636.1 DnaJ-like chaperonin [Gordonia phage Pupper]
MVDADIRHSSTFIPGGSGFPSACRDIAPLPINTFDPHGYYAELGVRPWATMDEIRAAARALYRRYHPDTGDKPDVRRFHRAHDIARTLLDPHARAKYNRTPPTKRLIDRAYVSELIDSGLFDGVDLDDLEDALNPTPATPQAQPDIWWDFYTVGRYRTDLWVARMWYRLFLQVAYSRGYRTTLKVLLYDGSDYLWDNNLHIVCIPRSWGPTPATVDTLLATMVQ